MSEKALYKEIGLVNTREMFKAAMAGKFAIPAYNFNNMEQLQAIALGCAESDSPFILQVSSGARKYANQTLLRYMAQGALEMIKATGSKLRFTLHLDHGDTFELCKSCIETGFSSVMIDGSHHPYEKNIEETRKVVEHAHKYDVTVEGELGVLAGIEDDVVAAKTRHMDDAFINAKGNNVTTEFFRYGLPLIGELPTRDLIRVPQVAKIMNAK